MTAYTSRNSKWLCRLNTLNNSARAKETEWWTDNGRDESKEEKRPSQHWRCWRGCRRIHLLRRFAMQRTKEHRLRSRRTKRRPPFSRTQTYVTDVARAYTHTHTNIYEQWNANNLESLDFVTWPLPMRHRSAWIGKRTRRKEKDKKQLVTHIPCFVRVPYAILRTQRNRRHLKGTKKQAVKTKESAKNKRKASSSRNTSACNGIETTSASEQVCFLFQGIFRRSCSFV